MPKKIRTDALLVEQQLAPNRSQAARFIMAGLVYTDNQRIDKAGHLLPIDTLLRVKQAEHQWASRGGMKLHHAMTHYNISAQDMVALDIGASTGGFSDVLLHYGAKKIFAVDVGYGQLAQRLRNDERVVVKERLNARHLTFDDIGEYAHILVCDASFISLQKILPAPLSLLTPSASCVVLIKPQFQLSKDYIGKQGVVRNDAYHQLAIDQVVAWFNEHDNTWHIHDIIASPIVGPKGNKEFLLYATRSP